MYIYSQLFNKHLKKGVSWSNKQNLLIQSKHTSFLLIALHLAQLIFFFSFAFYGLLLNFDFEILAISDSWLFPCAKLKVHLIARFVLT